MKVGIVKFSCQSQAHISQKKNRCLSHTHTPNTLKRTHQNTLTTCQNLYTETHDHTHTNTLDLTNIHKHIHLCTPTRTRTHTNRAVFSRHCGFPPSFSPSLPLNDSFVCIWNSTRKQTDRIWTINHFGWLDPALTFWLFLSAKDQIFCYLCIAVKLVEHVADRKGKNRGCEERN